MFKTFKIFLLILTLGIFILPQQLVFAQETEQCCEQTSTENNCCTTEKNDPCNTGNKDSKNPTKKDCEKDCSACHTCSVTIVLNFITPEISQQLSQQFPWFNNGFSYKIAAFTSDFNNIWQPPKIA